MQDDGYFSINEDGRTAPCYICGGLSKVDMTIFCLDKEYVVCADCFEDAINTDRVCIILELRDIMLDYKVKKERKRNG